MNEVTPEHWLQKKEQAAAKRRETKRRYRERQRAKALSD